MANCIDCDDGLCYMNCVPWCPKGQRFVERVGNHTITEDLNGCYRVYVTAGECLGLHGTERRARESIRRSVALSSQTQNTEAG